MALALAQRVALAVQVQVQPSRPQWRWGGAPPQALRQAAHRLAEAGFGVEALEGALWGARLGGAEAEAASQVAFLPVRDLAPPWAVFAPLCGANRPEWPTATGHAKAPRPLRPKACAWTGAVGRCWSSRFKCPLGAGWCSEGLYFATKLWQWREAG